MTIEQKLKFLKDEFTLALEKVKLDLPMVTSDRTIAEHAVNSIMLLGNTMQTRHHEFDTPIFTKSGLKERASER